ncbi:Putative protein C12orf29 like protein [Chelonia mydas]|uniref:RNA ligase 1 n=1 Tax=Chelonia mydas TaxID=8469 RepID=M7BKU2_CHEMY|nr:Putative protein C12orf29 like protein [Chelonia mydas]
MVALVEFIWNIEEDFRPVPECWIPAKEIRQSSGNPLPDENGHIPGWVPVEKNSKQYRWHSSVVNYEAEIALILKSHADDPGRLEISSVPLSDLLEQTLELIGTNINANPYALREAQAESTGECQQSTHCGEDTTLHRHHLGMCWPIPETYLNSQPVVIAVNGTKYDCDFEPKCLFNHFSKLDGQRFSRLKDIKFDV